jgi:hypothetical protein
VQTLQLVSQLFLIVQWIICTASCNDCPDRIQPAERMDQSPLVVISILHHDIFVRGQRHSSSNQDIKRCMIVLQIDLPNTCNMDTMIRIHEQTHLEVMYALVIFGTYVSRSDGESPFK